MSGIDAFYSSLLDQIAELQKANDDLKRPIVVEKLSDSDLVKKKKEAYDMIKSIEKEETKREQRTCTICFSDDFIKLARYQDYWTADGCKCNARICCNCVTIICKNTSGYTGCPSCRKNVDQTVPLC